MAGFNTIFLIAAAAAGSVAGPSLAQAAPSGTAALERVIAFDNPSDPWLSERSSALFSPLWNQASASVAVPGIGLTRVSTSSTAAGWDIHRVALKGEWHDLTLSEFAMTGLPNSGIGAYELHFAESAKTTLARLQSMGFPLTGVGRAVQTGDAECGSKLSVSGDNSRSVFTISFSC